MPIEHHCVRWQNWKTTLYFHINIWSTDNINVSKSGNHFFRNYLPLLGTVCFNPKWNYFIQKYFPLSSLISHKQCATVEEPLSSLSDIFMDSSRTQVLEFRKKTPALINNCCKKMIKRKKYTSNCIYQSYLPFLRFVQTQLVFLLNINFSINKILIKDVEVTEPQGFLNHTILYNIFSLSMIAVRQKLLCFHSNYSLQNAKNNMSLYNTNIVAVRTRWTKNAVL